MLSVLISNEEFFLSDTQQNTYYAMDEPLRCHYDEFPETDAITFYYNFLWNQRIAFALHPT